MILEKFRNKYRIPSSRAPWWDYGWNAAYYVTICTKNRLFWFGDVVNREMKNLGSIIRGFKIGVTKYARNIASEFSWQARYHDHIIRNEKSYLNIANDIINNPSNWKSDQFNPMNRNEF
jgi:hypothetical protein